MAVTLQQIAQVAGVSRGTVDRALNNRGRIKPEVAERIRNIAEEMGYQPNRAGRALAMTKRAIKIGVILQSAETPFMQEVYKGVESAREEVERMGGSVEAALSDGIDADEVISIMENFRQKGCNGIALLPNEDERLKRTIDRFVEEYGIPIITLNADVSNTKRLCFVGQDAFQSGRTAAGLMAGLIGERGKMVVISGHRDNPSLTNRAEGFCSEIRKVYPDITLLNTRYCKDDSKIAKKIMEELLQTEPDLSGVYMTSPGEQGVCEVLRQQKTVQRVRMVAHDFVGGNRENMQEGIVDFLIGQDPDVQGYEPIMILFRLLFDGVGPEQEFQFTDIVIKNRYNI